MRRFKDLSGQKFGRLLIIKRVYIPDRAGVLYKCICDCGVEKIVNSGALTGGSTKSCGCFGREIRVKDMTGKRFGRLLVKEFSHTSDNQMAYWKCICDCGNECISNGAYLRSGVSKSCGCLHAEKTKERWLKHGAKWRDMREPYLPSKIIIKGAISRIEIRNKTRELIDYALIDTEDIDKVKDYIWSLSSSGYVAGRKPGEGGKKIYIHRLISVVKKSMIDHVNNNKLDNRKSNLRRANHSENFQNQRKRKTYAGKPCSSIYKGVSYDKKSGKWIAQITVYKKPIRLGGYEDEVSAGIAYNKAAIKYFGDFANINEI